MSKQSSVLAQSATQLAISVTEDSWAAALPSLIERFAGISYEGDNSTMRLEKVCLNKQALKARIEANFRSSFPQVYPKGTRIPDTIWDSWTQAVQDFVDQQIARLQEDKWTIKSYNRSFAYSNSEGCYIEAAQVRSELLIDLDRQHLAASIYESECERKLVDLEKKLLASDDIRIINAKKRVQIAAERMAAVNKAIVADLAAKAALEAKA